ncbi:MAG: ankyrin repeat domain-containing protein, partial [Pseudomonadales bacterium]|nr:ankyrin repeat domain-containing protein [Pseudomonadales bacterium]
MHTFLANVTRLSNAARPRRLSLALLLALSLPLQAQAGPLADAAQHGDINAVRALLQQGATADEPQVDGATALHWAVQNN